VPVVARMNDQYRALVAGELGRHGITDPRVTEIVFMALDGLVLHQSVYGDTARTRGAVESLQEMLAPLVVHDPPPA
jgi:hypothetical protein